MGSIKFISYPMVNRKLPESLFKPRNIPSLKTRITLNPTRIELTQQKPRFKWLEINQNNITKSERDAILKLPKTMEKRCKAFMRQIICYSPDKGSLDELLSDWVRIMNPKRADWLTVLKELSFLDHPLFLQISGLALLEDSFEGNVRDYTKLINLYGKCGRIQDAENTLLAMTEKGLTCDQITLTTLIQMYSKAGHFELALETFEQMKLLGQPLDKRSYGTMIMAYIRADMPDKGEDLIREMEHQDFYAGTEIYKALLRTYSMKGDADGAQRVFDAIQVAGIHPDINLFAHLINACCLSGQTQKARVAFDNMRKAGIETDDRCVALLIAAYEKEKKLNTALDFLVCLERDGVLIGKEASQLLAEWFRKLGVVEDVAQVLRECVANSGAS